MLIFSTNNRHLHLERLATLLFLDCAESGVFITLYMYGVPIAIWEALMFSAPTFVSRLKYSISRSQYLAEYTPHFDWGQYEVQTTPRAVNLPS